MNNLFISYILCLFLGRLVTSLVREFLEFFNLEYTLAVFDPETNIVRHFVMGR